MIPSRAPIVLVLLGLVAVGPTAAHAQDRDERALESGVLSLRSCGWERLDWETPAGQRNVVTPAVRLVATYNVPHLRCGGQSTPGLDERLPWLPLPKTAAVRSAASLWRGTLIGAAIGFVASIVWWQLIQEEDNDSLLNGYAAAAGIVGGGLTGLGVAIVF